MKNINTHSNEMCNSKENVFYKTFIFCSIFFLLNTHTVFSGKLETQTDSSLVQKVKNLLRFKLSGLYGADETVMYSDSLATDKFDYNYDALKMLSPSAGVPNIYFRMSDYNLSINVLSKIFADKEIPLDVVIKTKGNYKIELLEMINFFPSSMAMMEDRLTGDFYDLRKMKTFNFTFSAGTIKDRFFIHITPPVTINAMPETCQQNDGKVSIVNPSNTPWDIIISDERGFKIFEANAFKGIANIEKLSDGNYEIFQKNQAGYSLNSFIKINSARDLSLGFSAPSEPVTLGSVVHFSSPIKGSGINYQWHFGDGTTVSDSSDVTHIYEQPGTYTVGLLISDSYCNNYTEETIYVASLEQPNSHTQIDSERSIHVFPNPATEDLNIKIADQNIHVEYLEVYDASGRLMIREEAIAADQFQMRRIPVINLPNGSYILLAGNKNTVQRERFLVSHNQ